MTQLTLQHCVPVTIWVSSVPTDKTLQLSAGGMPGDGDVKVSGTGPPEDSVATGTNDSFFYPGCTSIVLHYIKSKGGPSSVTVEYTLTP